MEKTMSKKAMATSGGLGLIAGQSDLRTQIVLLIALAMFLAADLYSERMKRKAPPNEDEAKA